VNDKVSYYQLDRSATWQPIVGYITRSIVTDVPSDLCVFVLVSVVPHRHIHIHNFILIFAFKITDFGEI